MKEFDIAILGSGASGCMCTMMLENSNKKVALIDKNKMSAKKLMATGNGRCNISNVHENKSDRFYNQSIDKYLQVFNFANLYQFLDSLGLMLYSDDEGRVYPISNSAKSVIDVINNRLENMTNLTIFNEKTVEKIEKYGEKFKITLNNQQIYAKKVVFSLGGNNNQMLESLGVKCKKSMPSLCGLQTTRSLKRLAGIRLAPVKVTSQTQSGKVYSEKGEILFREKGLSGIVIFNCSSLFAREGLFNGTITLDLLPDFTHEKLVNTLSKRRKINNKVSNFFDGMFVREVGYYLLEKCKINEERSSSQLTDKEIESLAKAIKSLEFSINAPLDNNQVFSGGAILQDLNFSLESKSCPNLYICGEATDIDGICGGYNLQWAWTSGYIVGKALF